MLFAGAWCSGACTGSLGGSTAVTSSRLAAARAKPVAGFIVGSLLVCPRYFRRAVDGIQPNMGLSGQRTLWLSWVMTSSELTLFLPSILSNDRFANYPKLRFCSLGCLGRVSFYYTLAIRRDFHDDVGSRKQSQPTIDYKGVFYMKQSVSK